MRKIGKIVTGNTPSKSEEKYWDWDFLWASATDFQGKYIFNTKQKLTKEWTIVARVLPKWSVLVTCIASIWLNAIAWKELSTNQQINAIIPNDIKSSERIYYSIEFLKVKLQMLAWKTAVPIVSKWVFEKFKIIFPPLPEQKAISSILSTCDESIATTQTLIDRLQRRHKALCQQLLTGKKRLQGFDGSFKKLQADEIFRNISIKNNPWERLLSATQDQWIIPRDMLEWRVTMPTTEANSYKLVQPWNFVISLRSFQGWLEYSTYRGIVSPAYTVLEPILPINDDFYKYYFKSYDFIWHLAVAVIGIRDWKQISFDNFCALSISYPSPEEQTAIASILNESQNQIDLAQSKLTKLKQQKQGIMQQLLTGKTRVPSDYL